MSTEKKKILAQQANIIQDQQIKLDNFKETLNSYQIQINELLDKKHNDFKQGMVNVEKLIDLKNNEENEDKIAKSINDEDVSKFFTQYEKVRVLNENLIQEENKLYEINLECNKSKQLLFNELNETKKIEDELKDNLNFLVKIESNNDERENSIKVSLENINQRVNVLNSELDKLNITSLDRDRMINTIKSILIKRLDNANNFFTDNAEVSRINDDLTTREVVEDSPSHLPNSFDESNFKKEEPGLSVQNVG